MTLFGSLVFIVIRTSQSRNERKSWETSGSVTTDGPRLTMVWLKFFNFTGVHGSESDTHSVETALNFDFFSGLAICSMVSLVRPWEQQWTAAPGWAREHEGHQLMLYGVFAVWDDFAQL